MSNDGAPIYGPFFGVMGSASAMIFSALGAAYGTAKAGAGIAAMAVMRPEQIMKSIIPIIMAGIIGNVVALLTVIRHEVTFFSPLNAQVSMVSLLGH